MPHRLAGMTISAGIAALALLVQPGECEADSGARHARLLSAPVALSSPLATDRLIAGETIVLSWLPLAELARHPQVEEWEAFLSLNGGATYPVRLTPHLDLDRRSFAVRLPGIATRQARLMLRFGDEKREIEFEFPDSLEILPSGHNDLQPAHLARGRGEPARSGDAGVAIWVEGSREGHAARRVMAARTGEEFEGIETSRLVEGPFASPAPAPPRLAVAALSTHPVADRCCAFPCAPSTPPRVDNLEPRRRTCRQNE